MASLTVDELTSAENKLLRLLQSIHFSKEIRTLQKNPNTAVGGKLQRLNPFLDNEGILRIGGRLNNSPIPLHQKYSIILPKSSVTELIIDQVHRRNHHSGTRSHYMRLDNATGQSTAEAKYDAPSRGASVVAEPIQ